MAVPALHPLADADPTAAELIAARPNLSAHAMDGLALDGVPLNAIADALGTPAWVISAETIRARVRRLRAALRAAGLDAHVHYAVKANDHLAVLRVVAAEGAGADVVSEGEFRRARRAGIAANDIVFSGVGKTDAEIRLALEEGVGQLNIESAEELEQIGALAAATGRTAPVALRINPDIDAGTHAKISTGRARDKFGVAFADAAALYARATAMPGVRPVGLAVHIGSQILSLAPYRAAYARLAALARELLAAGHRVEQLDCGGGLGVPYRNEPAPSPEALANAIAGTIGGLNLKVILEPGRWIVAQAGLLLSAVRLVKRTGDQAFVVLDAGMNDLVRPAMYEAWHGIVPVGAADLARAPAPADIVGPVCETGDTFARDRLLPPLAPGARVAILDAGAYGSVMSSTYNARPQAAIALIEAGRWAEIRPRQPIEALWQDERVPDWLP
ncbi:MAG TPA: diaminopimelate decarboxylase [Acetobacteraceae bacterium]|nr:diaminopimelate decarboxylase [Acetobacteraceae bacterium]